MHARRQLHGKVMDVAVDCTLNWKYSGKKSGFVNGKGSAVANVDQTNVDTSFAFESKSFKLYPPNSVKSKGCKSSITFSKMEFSGAPRRGPGPITHCRSVLVVLLRIQSCYSLPLYASVASPGGITSLIASAFKYVPVAARCWRRRGSECSS